MERPIIRIPEHIIALISAGEVIERPAYAVKELVENAIDAQATFIEVQIEEAGLRRIQVQDNGIGMSQRDLELSFLPHTTSKLQDEDNLIGIKTLGFRGEALSSIAAISQMTIKSRLQQSDVGTVVMIYNGNIEEIAPIGTPMGTIVIVDDLFAHVPARKKFLKSIQTEFRHISDVVMSYALSYPNIHFVLLHKKKVIFDLPQKENTLDRIRYFLGPSLFHELLPLYYEDDYIQITGFIGKPHIAGKQSLKQYLYINNRAVTDRMISLAAREAFGSLLPANSTPIFLMNLTLPHEMVDINVHPRKEQVAFIESKTIFDAVKLAVTQVLTDNNVTFRMASFTKSNSAKTGETTSFAGQLLKQHVSEETAFSDTKVQKVFQVHNTYIVGNTPDGLSLFDQHAVHERILFERFTQAFLIQKKDKERYQMPKPVPLELSLTESQLFEEYHEEFENVGFVIDHFQGTSFILRAIPLLFKGRNIEKILRDMLDDLQGKGVLSSIDIRSQRMLAFLSCRAAVKAGDRLTEKQMKELIHNLSDVPNNTTCPHGRPTKMQITVKELHKLFKRE